MSAQFAATAAVVALMLGVPFAILVERSQPFVRRVCWAMGLLVLMVPPYIVSESWIVLLGPAGKLSRPISAMIGFGPHSHDPVDRARFAVPGFVYTWSAVGGLMGCCLFPILALAVGSAYRRTDHRMFESARIARGPGGVFSVAGRILLMPAVGAALLVFAVSLTEFAVPQQLRVRTIGEPIYELIQEGDLAGAAAMCIPLLPVVLAAGVAGALVLVRSRSASMAGLEGEVPKFAGQGTGFLSGFLAVLMTLIAITSSLILPATSLIWLGATAKLPPPSDIGRHKLLRASGFVDSFCGAWGLAHEDAIRTVLVAALAATLATVFSISVVRLASRIRWGAALGALGAGLAIPPAVVGLGAKTLWDHDMVRQIGQSFAVVMLMWFARFLPVTIFLVQGALARVPRELENAAALAGRGPAGRFFAVVLPNAIPGIVAAWLAMYVLCATEFGATLVDQPPGSPFLAPSIINLMRRGQDPEIAACQVLLLAVVALPLIPVAIAAIWRRGRNSNLEATQ